MSQVLILGGTGATGRLIAKHLLAVSDVDISIASRHIDRAQTFIHELNRAFTGHRADAVYANASDEKALKGAMAGHEIVIVAAPTTAHTKTVARAALDSGTDYLDVQLGSQKLELLRSLAPQIIQNGRCFITEAGFHPGLPSALVRFAAAHFDHLDSAITAGYLNMGDKLPYTEAIDELAAAFGDYSAQVFRNGAWTERWNADYRNFDFGGDIGTRECVSMFFEELRDLPNQIPTLRETGFYISKTHWFTDYVISPLVMIACRKLPPRAIHFFGKLLWWSMHNFHRPPYGVELQVLAQGLRDGKDATMHFSAFHSDGYELTAIPVVAALLQYLDGTVRKPGLWMMGHLVDPTRLIKDMERMGVKTVTSIRTATSNEKTALSDSGDGRSLVSSSPLR